MSETPGNREASRYRRHVLVLVIAIVATYANAIPGEFVWLDDSLVRDGGYRLVDAEDWNRLWTLSMDRYLLRGQAVEPGKGGYWRPLFAMSLSLDWLLWGDRPALFHAENILWHIGVVLGLYALGRRLFAPLRHGPAIAFGSALIFALHPLGIYATTWISGRNDSMSSAFGVFSLLAFLRGVDAHSRESRANGHPGAWWLASALLMTCSALCKELGLLVPAVATLLWWTLPDGSASSAWRRKLARAPVVGLAALWGVAVAIITYRMKVLDITALGYPYPADTLLANVATSATLAWYYLGRILIPRPPFLSDGWPIVQQLGVREVAAVAGLAIAGVLTFKAVLRRWAIAPALAWTVVWFLPASGLVPLRHFRAERYLYPAYWGVGAALLISILHSSPLGRARGADRWIPAVFVVLALVLGAVTVRSNTIWWTHERLFRDAIARDERYVEGRIALSRFLLREGRNEEVVTLSRSAIRDGSRTTWTSFWVPYLAHYYLGLALERLERPTEALYEYKTALRYRTDDPVSLCHAGNVLYSLRRYREARGYYARSLEQDSGNAECWSQLAATHLRLHETSRAIELLEPLVELYPEDPTVRRNLSEALLAQREFDRAEPHLAKLVELQPERADARARWAEALWGQGARARARAVWNDANAQAPDDPVVGEVGRLLHGAAPLPSDS